MSENSVSRRSVLKGAAWVIPSIAVAIATPAISASINPSVTGGELHTNGNAFAWLENGEPVGQVNFNGINWNGYGADGDYPVGSVVITLSLPGEITSIVGDFDFWEISYNGNTATFLNKVVFEKDSVISDNTPVIIHGKFPPGGSYTSNVIPDGIGVTGSTARGTHNFA